MYGNVERVVDIFLSDEKPELRSAVGKLLGLFGNDSVRFDSIISTLKTLLAHKNLDVKLGAMETLRGLAVKRKYSFITRLQML
jgi:hypothetical protein